ncbi:MAG: cysteine-rich CWC family protein [Flavobacteriales bacterium]|nr:cysteine-rich CWC family protein [Flavobacteriales bacterium]
MCAGKLSSPNRPNHRCPACGQLFYCHENEGCWCDKIPLTRWVLAILRRRYIGCLCKNCLLRHSIQPN